MKLMKKTTAAAVTPPRGRVHYTNTVTCSSWERSVNALAWLRSNEVFRPHAKITTAPDGSVTALLPNARVTAQARFLQVTFASREEMDRFLANARWTDRETDC
jgi:hypothetical protein